MIKWLKVSNNWDEVKASARTTINKDGAGLTPSDSWKKSILLAEHSPIRKIKVSWKWSDLKYWVSVHFVRHKFGIEHFVSTQRSDRTGQERDSKSQDSLVTHECEANAQALINISRKRLCHQASYETRKAWEEVRNEIALADPVLASVMVKECVYRGFCTEMKSCHYCDTYAYELELKQYRDKFKE